MPVKIYIKIKDLAEKQNNSFGRFVMLCAFILNSEKYIFQQGILTVVTTLKKNCVRVVMHVVHMTTNDVTESNEICKENLKCFFILYFKIFRYFLFQSVLTLFSIRSTLLSIRKELKRII